MKKILLTILVFFMAILTLTACKNKKPSGGVEEPGGNDGENNGSEVYDAIGFTIHFNRKDNNYSTWGLWLWEDGKEGGIYEFEGTDAAKTAKKALKAQNRKNKNN